MNIKSGVLIVSWICIPAAVLAQESVRYTVLMMEKPAGVQTTVAADGCAVSYEYNDRGRGPKLTARVRLDAAGVPVSIEMDGRRLHQGAGAPRRFTFGRRPRALEEQRGGGRAEARRPRVLSEHARASGRVGLARARAAASAGAAHGVVARG